MITLIDHRYTEEKAISAPNPSSFTCPTCGAPLHPTAGQTEITCQYCGNTVIVPESLRISTPTPPVSPPAPVQVSILEVMENLREAEAQQRGQQFSQTPMPIPMQTQRRRRGGCGCGCLSTLFTIVIAVIVIGAISLGVYASSNPQGAAAFLADPGKALNDILAQIKSGIAQTSPQFTSFTAPPITARNGTGVTVRWDTNGATVRLETLNTAGTVIQTTSLASSGSYLISVRGSPGDTAIYRLVASLNGQTATKPFTITVIR